MAGRGKKQSKETLEKPGGGAPLSFPCKENNGKQELEQELSLQGDYNGLGALGLKMAAKGETQNKEVSYVDEKG